MSRKLDAAIAEALGHEVEWKHAEIGYDRAYSITWNKDADLHPTTTDGQVVDFYSTDGNAMLELDREMRERGLYLQISFDQHGCYTQYKLRSEVFMDGGSHAKEEPLTRALAAHKALKGKEWQE